MPDDRCQMTNFKISAPTGWRFSSIGALSRMALDSGKVAEASRLWLSGETPLPPFETAELKRTRLADAPDRKVRPTPALPHLTFLAPSALSWKPPSKFGPTKFAGSELAHISGRYPTCRNLFFRASCRKAAQLGLIPERYICTLSRERLDRRGITFPCLPVPHLRRPRLYGKK